MSNTAVDRSYKGVKHRAFPLIKKMKMNNK